MGFCLNLNGEEYKANGKVEMTEMFNIEKFIRNNWNNLYKFASVGATGAIVNLVLLWALTSYGHVYYLASAVIAIEISIIWNFILNTKITFKYKFVDRNSTIYALIKYHLTSLFGSLINLSVLFILTEFFKSHYLISEFIAIMLAFGFNYLISANYVWRNEA